MKFLNNYLGVCLDKFYVKKFICLKIDKTTIEPT